MTNAGPIVFLHIPKTAGSTFGTVLRRNMPTGDFHVPNICRESEALAHRLEWIASQPAGRVKSIRGHVSLSWRARLPANARYVTFVREPVARHLSHFRHLYRKRIAAGTAPSIEEALASGRFIDLVDNLQVRMLCGLEDCLTRPADDELLQAALRELPLLDFVGVTERFPESVLLAGEWLGLRALGYRAERITGAPLEMTAVEALRAHNELDLELYREARALYDPRLDRMSRSRARALLRADAMLRTGRPVADARAGAAVAAYWLGNGRIAAAHAVARARKSTGVRRLRQLLVRKRADGPERPAL